MIAVDKKPLPVDCTSCIEIVDEAKGGDIDNGIQTEYFSTITLAYHNDIHKLYKKHGLFNYFDVDLGNRLISGCRCDLYSV